MAGSTGSAREEAERLVAAVLARASEQDLSRTRQRVTEGIGALSGSLAGLVGQFTGEAPPPPKAENPPKAEKQPEHLFPGWSTGSAECCVCPVCKAIAAARNPSPATALRLATGAGDVATGAAKVMRGLSALAGTSAKPPAKKQPPSRPAFDPDVTWSAATRAAGPHETPAPPADPATQDPWSAATRSPAPPAAPPAAAPAPQPPKPTVKTPEPDEATRRRDPWGAATASLPPIAHVAPHGEGGPGSASGDPGTRTKKGVEVPGRTAVDHDGPGPATGDDARAGDAG